MPRAQPGQRFGGRQKGTPNKITALLKDDILEAAEQAHPQGRIGYLKWLAKEHAVAFAGLLGKVLPLTVAGDPDNPVKHEHSLTTDAERAAAIMELLTKAKG